MRQAEKGQAVIETVVLGLLLLAPLLWALTVLAELHRGALATTAAAREAGFEAARAESLVEAERSIGPAMRQAFADHGLEPERARVRWSADPGLARGGTVEVEVRYPVAVFRAPFIGRVSQPSIWVTARHAARIDPYRSRS